jgi:hypothetical protein
LPGVNTWPFRNVPSPFAEKDGYIAVITRSSISWAEDNEIGFGVSVEIRRGDAIAVLTRTEVHGCFESAVAIVQQYAHASIAGIDDRQIQRAISVESPIATPNGAAPTG